ncbi:MAG: GTPase Era [Nitrospirae bacterium]|nr:GTPase Era [Nitrospirota bacterium]
MPNKEEEKEFRSGFVSIIGRPNVGKSTLLNSILGEKISIVTPKPQTTRNRIIGIKTLPYAQIIFIDTPGIHKPRHKLGNKMVKTALDAFKEVDIILFMAEPREPEKGDQFIIRLLKEIHSPVFLLINKIDTVKKSQLLPLIERLKNLYPFKEIIPISALKQDGIDIIIERTYDYLIKGPKYYPDDIITDQLERFMVSEIIREKATEITEEEVPYSIAVEIVEWKERENGIILIRGNIYVERDSQKGIIIGKDGRMLKAIGTASRADIEKLLNTKVFLELWVKVKKDWRNNLRTLEELGYK